MPRKSYMPQHNGSGVKNSDLLNFTDRKSSNASGTRKSYMNTEDAAKIHKELRESSNERAVPQPVLPKSRPSVVQARDPSKTPITNPVEAYQQSTPHVEVARHSVVQQRQVPRATVVSDNLKVPILQLDRRDGVMQAGAGNNGF